MATKMEMAREMEIRKVMETGGRWRWGGVDMERD
jgi:hypothetical protein